MLKGRGKIVIAGLIISFFLTCYLVLSQVIPRQTSEKKVATAITEGEISPTGSLISNFITSSPSQAIFHSAETSIQSLPRGDKEQALVLKVVDGDTLSVSVSGKKETIRIIGINTPETVDPRRPVECFGKEASERAKSILNGQTVFLASDPTQTERDKYNRLLRYVFLQDGTDYGKKMITDGYAYEYTYNVPYQYQVEYKIAQKNAEAKGSGLWANDTCSVVSIDKPPNVTSSLSSGGDKDCKDFATQNEAQLYFKSKGGNSTNNVDKLDGSDRDGLVCETLP